MQAFADTAVTEQTVSWKEFFSPALLEEIRAYIGRPVEEYRVGSLALYPSAPLYNGFYCIDGYSNNYDIAYKHAFREIVAAELEKSASLRGHVDGWGNRCYRFFSELGQQYFFRKNQRENAEKSGIFRRCPGKLGV